MAHYAYERLSALDNSFLVFEDANANTPMHVASAAIFEAGPLSAGDGGINIERITAHIASRLHRIPRYRERLARIPIEGHPVWIDDERFNLHYHVRHTCLPKPGDERQLKRMSARIMSQQLDRGKPLWETWIVEGLEGGRMAMLSKVHHCMVDGVSGVDLLTVLLSPTPTTAIHDPVRWIPRPAPSAAALLRDEIGARINAPLSFVSRLLRQPAAVMTEARDDLEAVAESLGASLRLASDTPLNAPIGPHRRFDWMPMDIAAVREVRQRLGGTMNDVVLATVSGAVRRFLERRSVDVSQLEFRVFVPVSMRGADDRGKLGNRVAGWFVDLPIAERDPRKVLASVRDTTMRLKGSRQSRGAEIFTEMSEWTGTSVLSLGMRLASRAHPFNLVVTNVPGPPQPLYLLGARMLEAYPMVPLAQNMGLGIALFSYAGRLFWGFNADWDVVPDLHDFVSAVGTSFAELRNAGSHAGKAPAPRKHVAHGIRPNGEMPAHL